MEGVQQIKDDIVVHGAGKEHNSRLWALLEKLAEDNITLRREKCKFVVPEVKWFGHIYSKQGSGEEAGHQGLEKARRQEGGQKLLADSCLLQSVHEARPGEDLC